MRAYFSGAPREIRTPVLALKGLRPGPLDDGGIESGILPNIFKSARFFRSACQAASGSTHFSLSKRGLLTHWPTG